MKRRCLIVIPVFILAVLYLLQGTVAHNSFKGEYECRPLLGVFTKEDTVADNGLEPGLLQPGDILITLSTHSLGWRHGHAALVIDRETTLECAVWGRDSALCDVNSWKKYADCKVLRVKGSDEQLGAMVAQYAKENLAGVPYHLSAGVIGLKAPEPEASYFGMQCAYLVWYAWNAFGYDLDSDGGRLVTTSDLTESELAEAVYEYNID